MSGEVLVVRRDNTAGHLTLEGRSDEGRPVALVTLADTGGSLHMWAYEGATLSPEVAYALGGALREWATRTKTGRHPRVPMFDEDRAEQ